MKVLQRIKKWANRKDIKIFLLALIPIIWIFMTHYAILWGWSFAFYDYKVGKKIANCDFVGFKNFTTFLTNRAFRANIVRVLRNTFGMYFTSLLFSPLPMLFAVFLNEIRSKKFQKVVQTVTTLPNFISWVIMYSLFLAIFGSRGAVNSFIQDVLGLDAAVNVINSSEHVWLTQTLIDKWKGLGWSAIVYFAAIAGVDQQMFEAAMVDGANRMQKIWYITLPQLVPTYFVLLIMGVGNVLNSSVEKLLLFGNSFNMEWIETLDLYVYKMGIGDGMFSYSIAIGILKSVVAIVLFSFANMLSKKVRGVSVF